MVATTQTLFNAEPATTTDDPVAKFDRIRNEIVEQYKADERVWVIGFSGGKDSTTLLQLVFYALQTLPKSELHKEVHVLCNDTLVENPAVVRYIDDTLAKIKAAGEELGFPLKVAEDTHDREILRDSIRTLLGLTVYSRLSSDLANQTSQVFNRKRSRCR